jgi:hypothetical protein
LTTCGAFAVGGWGWIAHCLRKLAKLSEGVN